MIESTDFTLWKFTKSFKRPEQYIPPIRRADGRWARSDREKADELADHLSNLIFTILMMKTF